MSTYTPQEIEEMRAAVAEADRLAAIEKAAIENEAMRPLREFTNSTEYKAVLAKLPGVLNAYRLDPRFMAFLDCLATGLPSLANVAGPLPDATPPAQA